MHIITWVCPPCSSVSQIIISHAQFQKHFSVQEFQLKSVSFEVFFSTIGFLLLFSSLWNFFISLASLASCLEKRHLCCFLSSSFVKRRFSRREHLLHISTIEHRASVESTVPRDISLGPHRQLVLSAAPHTKDESLLLSKDSVHNTRRPSWKKDDL